METVARSSMPCVAGEVRRPGGHRVDLAEAEAQDVDVVDGVLNEAPAAGLRHVGPPLRGVGALDGEVLVVAEDGGHRRPSVPPATRSRRARKTGALRSTSPHWLGTPDAATASTSDWAPARSTASGFSQKTARPAEGPRRRRGGAPRSACRPRRHRSAGPPRRRRRRPGRSAPTASAKPRARRSRGRGPRRWRRRSRPPSIIALRPSPWAQAMRPVPTKPIRTMAGH